jgi:ribosomal protein S12 methylthiotransferase
MSSLRPHRMRFYIASLGCAKNDVISDHMAQLLLDAGHVIVDAPQKADLLLVNTCGFIESARQESLVALRDLAGKKRPHQKLVAAGCYVQLAGDPLLDSVPGIDGLLGTRRWMEIGSLLDDLGQRHEPEATILLGDPAPQALAKAQNRVLRSSSVATAYLRIADGCNAPCAFCSIPQIKGPLLSRSVEEILNEARYLNEHGASELVVIAQDTTAYGQDRGEKNALPGLLETILHAIPDVSWLRLMYTYPQHITPELIDLVAEQPKICHYLDLPLQHAHPATLRRMRRPHDTDQVRRVLADLRKLVPDVALRTSLIVGYPGETEEEFSALLEFMEETAFDKVGVFLYSREAGTAAYELPNQIPQALKEERYHRLMAAQQNISLKRNQAQVNRILDVLVEGVGEGLSLGRSYRDAPEIDGLVIFKGEAPVGKFAAVHITGAEEYDLTGTWLHQQSGNAKKSAPGSRRR